jgi:zinc transport system substrate-binding protein
MPAFFPRPLRHLRSALLALALPLAPIAAAQAKEPLRIVASIAPVHSLLSELVGDQGEVTLLVPPGSSPHTYSLTPSAAASLSKAQVIFWVGPEMETFLPRMLDSLPNSATTVALSSLPNVHVLPLRHGGAWGEGHHHHGDEAHHDDDHDQDHDADHDAHDHADHTDHQAHDAHGEHEKHEEHEEHTDQDGGHDDDHDQPGVAMVDPHQWLDPENARLWVAGMAHTLAEADPEHASLYESRSQALDRKLTVLEADLKAQLAPVAGVPYLVFHDAYHYFEDRYGLSPVGALSIDPGQSLGAKRLVALKTQISATGARCIFAEPQFSDALPKLLGEETGAHLGTADPLGQAFGPGPEQYFQTQRALAASFADCLSQPAH